MNVVKFRFNYLLELWTNTRQYAVILASVVTTNTLYVNGTEVTGEMYRNWYQYWQESQNDLKPRYNNNYLRQ